MHRVCVCAAGFGALTVLDLSQNSLTTLPSDALAGCSSLVSLSLSSNRLKVCSLSHVSGCLHIVLLEVWYVCGEHIVH